jgi:acyl-CoA thioesterase
MSTRGDLATAVGKWRRQLAFDDGASMTPPVGSRAMSATRGQAALDQLVSILDLEELELNLFRGRTPKEDRVRVFGGQVAGQALVAAGRTVEDGLVVHSLHSYFLRPGDPSIPIVYQVEPPARRSELHDAAGDRDPARHADLQPSASFQRPEHGIEHQLDIPPAPGPESLPTFRERIEPYLEKVHPDSSAGCNASARSRCGTNPPDYLHPEKRPPSQLVVDPRRRYVAGRAAPPAPVHRRVRPPT